MIKRITLFIFYLFSLHLWSQDWKTYPYEPDGAEIAFPVDEGQHDGEPIEWWYTTGQVVGQNTGTRYSYMLTYFHYPYQSFDGFRILNITNEDTGEHLFDTKPLRYDELRDNELYIEASSRFLPKPEYWRNKTDNSGELVPFEYIIQAATGSTELSLEYNTVKRPLILGETGRFPQGASNYTYYYSQTGIEVTGTLTFRNVTEPVSGPGWIDRQYGSFNPLVSEKYEWMSMQLSNGMDLNLWNIFTPEREVPDDLRYRFMSGYVDESTQFTTKDFEIERLEYDWMEDEERCYSSKWRLTSTSLQLDLLISINHEDAEVQLPFRFYEGATSISGTVSGQNVTGIGFAELLHSYEHPEVSMVHPVDGAFYSSEEIVWQVDNPDAGRPLLYDVAYSIDDLASFKTIAEGLTEPKFLWTNPDIQTGEEIWFRVRSYSIDKTLISETISDKSSSFTLPVGDVEIQEFSMYPNPSQEVMHLELPGLSDRVDYTIYDSNGRLSGSGTLSGSRTFEIELNGLTSGIYWLVLTSDQGVNKKKFIVE